MQPLTQFSRKESADRSEAILFTVRSAQLLAASLINNLGIDSAVLDAQLMLAHTLNKTRLFIQLNGHLFLLPNEIAQFFHMVSRRLMFEPIAYILGHKEFYGLEFLVSKDCLIPRPDTEVVVEKCLELIEENANDTVIDLCTGSGAIAITIQKARPHTKVLASDISEDALNLAQKNAHNLGVSERVLFYQGDLFAAFPSGVQARLIVSNPPYIASNKIAGLSPTVRNHEPRQALDAGDDGGVTFYRRILETAPLYLQACGYLVMEIGFDQRLEIEKLIGPKWRLVEFFRDLASNTRGIVLQKK